MTILYEPKGRAREYSPLAANLYKGCSHACVYCYAPKATFTAREAFLRPAPRANVINLLGKDAESRKTKSPVLLCFTCDPYQPLNNIFGLARNAIETLNEAGFPVHVLTKGGMRAQRDFDLLKKNAENAFASTLTCLDEAESARWEPGAAAPQDRIAAIKTAHEAGIKTWVSFEPVLNPEWVYQLLERTRPYVDLYKVGKLNYHPRSKEIDWPAFRKRIVDALKSAGKAYYIKQDLLAA